MTFGFGAGVQRLGSVAVDTVAALNALMPAADVRPTGFVYADPTPALNGVYTWSGSAWARQRGLPDGVAAYASVAGTANAITATPASGVDPAVCKVAVITPVAANTGAATLNGEAIKDRSGNALSAGALAVGVAALLLRDGAQWRLLTGNVSEISDVSGLQVALDGKVGAVHTHAQSDVTGLTDALAAKADGAATTSALALKAPLASPAFTGNPTAPTPSPGDNDTSIATTGFVKAAIDVVLGGVSSAFDTLAELAAAIATKADAAATTTALAGKQASNAILTSLSGLTIAAGDLIVGTGANALAKLAKGSAGQVLTMNAGGTAPEWGSAPGLTSVKETVYEASGNYAPNADGKFYEFVVVGAGGGGAAGNSGNTNESGSAGKHGTAGAVVVSSGPKANVGNAAIAITIGVKSANLGVAATPSSVAGLVSADSGRTSANSGTGVATSGSSNLPQTAVYGVAAFDMAPNYTKLPWNLVHPAPAGAGGRGGNAGSSGSSGGNSGGSGGAGSPAVVVVREYL